MGNPVKEIRGCGGPRARAGAYHQSAPRRRTVRRVTPKRSVIASGCLPVGGWRETSASRGRHGAYPDLSHHCCGGPGGGVRTVASEPNRRGVMRVARRQLALAAALAFVGSTSASAAETVKIGAAL